MVHLIEIIKTFFSTYVASAEGIATLSIFLVLLLKLLINHKTTALDFKKTVLSIPSEITFLLIGFILSSVILENCLPKSETIIANVLLLFIVLIAQYAVERYLDDKLSGKLKLKIILIILVMYVVSIGLYIYIVF